MTGTETETAAWMKSLGVPFVDVVFVRYNGSTDYESHVNDPLTLRETIDMSTLAARSRAWVYPTQAGWMVVRRGKPDKLMPTKEAAEMLAIHSG
jgi:hypothetical protein